MVDIMHIMSFGLLQLFDFLKSRQLISSLFLPLR